MYSNKAIFKYDGCLSIWKVIVVVIMVFVNNIKYCKAYSKNHIDQTDQAIKKDYNKQEKQINHLISPLHSLLYTQRDNRNVQKGGTAIPELSCFCIWY